MQITSHKQVERTRFKSVNNARCDLYMVGNMQVKYCSISFQVFFEIQKIISFDKKRLSASSFEQFEEINLKWNVPYWDVAHFKVLHVV